MKPVMYKITDKKGRSRMKCTVKDVLDMTGFSIENEEDIQGIILDNYTITPVYDKPDQLRIKED